MCGISGIYRFDKKPVSKEDISSSLEKLCHRGPDASGVYIDKAAGLGHTRLSIIDLSQNGSQPMCNEDESIWIICNGEIYNFHEIKKSLIKSGHKFKSESDTEVLIHLYEEHSEKPENFLDEVRGMFAFAIWDKKKERMIIARDRFGIKPLFYSKDNDQLIFASELTSLLPFYKGSLHIDWTSIYEYLLLLTVPAPNTVYQEIKHVDPGHMIIIEHNKFKIHCYWKLNCKPDKMLTSEEDIEYNINNCLKEVMQQHLMSDVPIGTFLSAGIDSTLVTSFAAEVNKNNLYTFCASFPGEDVDEGKIAAQTARELKTKHLEFSMTEGFLDELDTIVQYMDQPMGLTSTISLFQISRLASKHVKVVLTGDGGDEIFGGYDHRHVPSFIPPQVRWMPEILRDLLGSILTKLTRKNSSGMEKEIHALGKAMVKNEAENYLHKLYVITPEKAIALIPEKNKNEVNKNRYSDNIKKLFKECKKADSLNRKLYVDIYSTLVDEMLFKSDRMTMGCSIEARVPFLDHKLVELAMQIPGRFKRNEKFGKIPLRKIVSKKFGKRLGYRKKSGFNSPLLEWLKTDNKTIHLFEKYWTILESTDMLEKESLKKFKKEILENPVIPASSVLSVLVLGLWFEKIKTYKAI